MNDNDKRHEYAAGLRALADFIETAPESLSDSMLGQKHLLCVNGEDAKADLALFIRHALDARLPVTKNYTDGWAGAVVQFGGGLEMEAYAQRELVCERVVKGTRELTKQVPDPEALAAVPTVTVTETVEDVEWVCAPLLAAEAVA